MRASVAKAWPAFCEAYEGVCLWMYLDVLLKVTTGIGFLIDSVKAAQALAWFRADGVRATDAEVEAEWKRVKALTVLAHKGGYAYAASARLQLLNPDVDRLLMDKTSTFWARLGQTLAKLEQFPADAQLAILDEAWQNGPAYLDEKKNGAYVWAGTRAALLAGDFTAAASHVPGSGDRADRRKRLFRNAATVINLGLDLDRLWDKATPHLEDEVTPADIEKLGALFDAKIETAMAALPKAPTVGEVAAAVWDADVIPSPEAKVDPGNPNFTAKKAASYAGVMARRARDTAQQARDLAQQAVDAVKAITPKPPVV